MSMGKYLKTLAIGAIASVMSSSLIAKADLEPPSSAAAPAAIANTSPPQQDLYMNASTQLIEWLKKNIPEGQFKCASDIYLKTLGLDKYGDTRSVGAKNAGLVSYFDQQIQSNPCFASIARRFYLTIENEDKLLQQISRRPQIVDKAGVGPFAHRSPGWIFDRALKATGGNPNAAMTLIGLCGNDDIGVTYNLPSTKVAPSILANELDPKKHVQKLMDEASDILRKTSNLSRSSEEYAFLSSQFIELREQIDFLQSGQAPGFSCPGLESSMYAPESLSKEINLPSSLIDEIKETQKTPSPNSIPPAKYYHFYASAFMGCQLAKCGISPSTAGQLQKFFASGYRALRLCPVIRNNLSFLRSIEDGLDIQYQDPRFPSALKERLLKSAKRARTNSNQPAETDDLFKCQKNPTLLFCRSPIQYVPEEQLNKTIDRFLQELDASMLYRRWYFGGGSIFGYDLPCTDLRLSGPDKLLQDDLFENRPQHLIRPPGSMCNIPGWSSQRCSAARAKLATWDIDFVWTRTQHEMGARFGATQCRKQDINESLDKRMCGVVTSPASSPPNKKPSAQ